MLRGGDAPPSWLHPTASHPAPHTHTPHTHAHTPTGTLTPLPYPTFLDCAAGGVRPVHAARDCAHLCLRQGQCRVRRRLHPRRAVLRSRLGTAAVRSQVQGMAGECVCVRVVCAGGGLPACIAGCRRCPPSLPISPPPMGGETRQRHGARQSCLRIPPRQGQGPAFQYRAQALSEPPCIALRRLPRRTSECCAPTRWPTTPRIPPSGGTTPSSEPLLPLLLPCSCWRD